MRIALKIACIIGILLIIAGLIIYGIFPQMVGGPVTAIVGGIMAVIYIIIYRQEIKESISIRSAKYGTNTAIYIAVMFLITCSAYVFLRIIGIK